MRKLVFFALSLLVFVGRLEAAECQEEKQVSIFEDRPWFKPFPGATHEPQSSLYFSRTKRMPFVGGPQSQTSLEGEVGIDAPIVIVDGTEEDKPIGSHCWGYGVWFAAVISLDLDFTLPGQPVMATDYLPSFRGKLAYGLSDDKRLGFLVEYCHESAHTTWDAVRENFVNFRWIDVNYECLKTGGEFEAENKWGILDFRFSSLFTLGQGHTGFYSADNATIMSSSRNWVPSVGIQYAQKKPHGWGYFVAALASADPVYNPDKKSGELEKIRVSRTFLIGMRNFSHKGLRLDPVLNYYIGRNPYGVFRIQNTWWSMRIGFIVRR